MSDLINTFSGRLSFAYDECKMSENGNVYLSRNVEEQYVIRNENDSLSEEIIRERIVDELHRASESEQLLPVELQGNNLQGAFFIMQGKSIQLMMDINGNVSGINHPLSLILPLIDGKHEIVDTVFLPNTDFHYIDPNLIGPLFFQEHPANYSEQVQKRSLLRYLSRIINYDPEIGNEGFGKRLTEPGVGRSFLVDFLSLANEPVYKDFSSTGIGLTPYSLKGFVGIGRNPDGKVALVRANNRKNAANRLNEIGCRAAKVVAIVIIPADGVQMMDGTLSSRAILIRGFKNILRVKQIDPIAGLYHSLQHSAKISSMIIEDILQFMDYRTSEMDSGKVCTMSSIASELERFAVSSGDICDIVSPIYPYSLMPEIIAKHYRQNIIKKYCPDILNFAARRVSLELNSELSLESYINWFAESLGEQLAVMKKNRFLHDYHHPGISRYKPDWIYTLIEHNVTLSAEFADLETAIFVDDSINEINEALQLTDEDIGILRNNFNEFHLTDYNCAKKIVRSLASAAFCCRIISEKDVLQKVAIFENAYNKTLPYGS